MNTKTLLGAVAALAVLPRAALADEAAPFPDRAHVAVVLDNLAGFVNTNTSYPNSNTPRQDNGSNVFGWFPATPVARFGVHGFFGGLTLGGGILYSHQDFELGLGSLGNDRSGTTLLGVAPRVGYAVAIGPTTALWLRGGFTYVSSSDSNDNGGSWQFSPGGEVYLVYAPVPHFGLTLGPFAEIGVAGKNTFCSGNTAGGIGGASACTDQDVRQRYLGFTFGVLADF
jgi:hypothetical protein